MAVLIRTHSPHVGVYYKINELVTDFLENLRYSIFLIPEVGFPEKHNFSGYLVRAFLCSQMHSAYHNVNP